MEAVEFIKQKARMCDYYSGSPCTHDDSGEICPAHNINCFTTTDHLEQLVAVVEQWAEEHPEKPEQERQKPEQEREQERPKRTKKDVLLAAFPNVRMEDSGIPTVCPLSLDKHYNCSKFKNCEECGCAYWLAEVEE